MIQFFHIEGVLKVGLNLMILVKQLCEHFWKRKGAGLLVKRPFKWVVHPYFANA